VPVIKVAARGFGAQGAAAPPLYAIARQFGGTNSRRGKTGLGSALTELADLLTAWLLRLTPDRTSTNEDLQVFPYSFFLVQATPVMRRMSRNLTAA